MVPKSVLNDLRRRVVESLIEQRRQGARHAIADAAALPSLRGEVAAGVADNARLTLCVLARTPDQIGAAADWAKSQPGTAVTIYCDLPDASDLAAAGPTCQQAGAAFGVATPRVILPGEDGLLDAIAAAGPAVVLVRNLTAMDYLAARLPGAALIGDQSLNVANELAANWLLSTGLSAITPANELTAQQVLAMLAHVPAGRVEIVAQHRPAMFHTRYCLLAGNLGCQGEGRPCAGRAPGRFALRDRISAELPIVCDAGCRNTIFAPRSLWRAGGLAELRRQGVNRLRVELVTEPAEEVASLLDRCLAAAGGETQNSE